LPSSRSNGSAIMPMIASPVSLLAYGALQPPCLNPPLGSSSGPPGACITPSSETCALTISILTAVPPFAWTAVHRPLSSRRTGQGGFDRAGEFVMARIRANPRVRNERTGSTGFVELRCHSPSLSRGRDGEGFSFAHPNLGLLTG